MRRCWVLFLLFIPAGAQADRRMTVVGDVVDTHARWTADGTRIVTDATIRTPEGDVVVSQLGGSVGGLGMRTFPGPELLQRGMQVSLDARASLDLSRREHISVDGVRVTGVPPGFVRTGPTGNGKYLFWESGCVFVTVDINGTNQVNGDAEFDAVDSSIAEWNGNVASCSFMQLQQTGRLASEVGRDNRNLIKFRDTTWCRPATKDDPARCYSPSAAGITTAVFVDDASSDRDGEIVDADIELNGADFAITHDGQTTGTNSCRSEITNTLTHELGHLLGLEHPCLAGGDPQREDGNGDPVPACSSTNDPAILDATMYNFQDCGETSKATLSQDDIDAICAIYPPAEDPGVCAPVGEEKGCCNSSTAPVSSTLLMALGIMLGFVVLRRRRTS
jgi:MYXO-CTERM domain-containing protein